MLIRSPRGWELPESAVTPERVFLNRRAFIAGAGLAGLGLVGMQRGAQAQESIPTADLYPAPNNPAYTVDRAITAEEVNTTYNNFYEFGSNKRIYREAQKLPVRPWTIEVGGMVKTPKVWDIDDLVRTMGLEERVYRHRCVEAWSMVAPWTGFPLSKLVDLAEPLGSAKYVRFETFMNPKVASEQRAKWYPWPYVEGLTIAEARNALPFMVTGAYGKPLPKQMGAPIRLALPWKYGFKSIKSIVRISFTEERPVSFWEEITPTEYGFWANVNPEVPHRRWSQATEEVLGTGERVPTLLHNGYAGQVAHLYKDLEQTRALYM